jgi:hypothetical protein
LAVAENASFAKDLTVSGNLNANFANASIQPVSIFGGVLPSNTFNNDVSLSERLFVTKAITTRDNLNVERDASFNRTMRVDGAVTLGNTLAVAENASFAKDLTVSGNLNANFANASIQPVSIFGGVLPSNTFNNDVSLSERLFVTKAITTRDNLNVERDASFNRTMRVGGAVTLGNTLAVAENATFAKDLTISGNLNANFANVIIPSSSISGGVLPENTFNNDVSLTRRLFVTNAITTRDNMIVERDASINRIMRVGGAVTLGNTLAVAENASFAKDLTVSGNLNAIFANGSIPSIAISGGVLPANTFNNDVSLTERLFVTKPITANNNLIVERDASINRIMRVGGAVTFGNTLAVAENASFAKDLTVSGNLNAIFANGSIPSIAISGGTLPANTLENDVTFLQRIITMNDASFNQRMNVAGTATFNNRLTARGDINAQNRVFVSGLAAFNDVTANRVSILNDASFNENVFINKDLTVYGRLSVQQYTNSSVINTTTVNYATIITEDLSVNGNITIENNANLYKLTVANTSTFNDRITANGLIRAQNGLDVTGNASVSGTLTATFADDTIPSSKIIGGALPANTLNNDVTFAQRIITGGDASFNNKINVANDATFNSRIISRGIINAQNGLNVTGNANVSGTLTATFADDTIPSSKIIGGVLPANTLNNDVTFAQRIITGGDASFNSKLYVGDDAIFNDRIISRGIINAQNGLNVTGNASVSGTLTATFADDTIPSSKIIGGVLPANTLNNDVTFAQRIITGGDASFNSKLYVGDDAIFNDRIISRGIINAQNGLNVTGNASVSGTLTATFADDSIPSSKIIGGALPANTLNNDVTFAQKIITGGDASFNSKINVGNDAIFNGRITANADVRAQNRLFVTRDSSFNGNVTINGNLFANYPVDSIPQSAVIGLLGGNQSASNIVFDTDINMQKRLFIANDVSSNGRLYVSGAGTSIIKNNLTVGGTFSAASYVPDSIPTSAINGLTALINNSAAVPNFGEDVSMNKRLFVTNDISSNGRIYVSGAGTSIIKNNLTVGGTFTAASYPDNSIPAAAITGLTTLINNSTALPNFSEDISMNKRLFVTNDISSNGRIYVSGAGTSIIKNNLTVGGTFSAASYPDNSIPAAAINGLTALINSTSTIPNFSEDVSMNKRLFVTGDVSSNGLLYVSGAGTSIIKNNLTVGNLINTTAITASGTLGVTGQTTLTNVSASNVSASGTLGVTGQTTLTDVAASNVTISGNLSVNGTTTTINATNLDISDNLIMISAGFTGTPANDSGILINRGNQSNVFMGWDESAKSFILGDTTATSLSTGNLSITPGTLSINDALLNGRLFVGTNSFMVGDVSMSAKLSVSGTTALNDNVTIASGKTFTVGTGGTTLGGTLAVSGASTFTGAATLGSTLAVSGASTFTGAATLASTLSVSGASTVTGATTLGSTLAVSGASTFFGAKTIGSTLVVSNATTLGTTLAVSGASTFFGAKTLASTLAVSGASTLSSTLVVSGASTLGSTLTVSGASTFTGAATLASTLAVSGASTFTGAATLATTLAVSGASTFFGAKTLASTLAVSNATTLSSTLVVSGASTLGSTLAVSGASTFTGAATLASTLAVTGASTFTGASTLASTLAVSGASTFFGAKTIASTLAVSGASTLSSTLVVSGASTLGSTLAVSGASTFTGAATLASTLAVSGASTVFGANTLASTLAVSGASTLSSTLVVSGATTLGSTLSVIGASTFTGAATLGSTLAVSGASTFYNTTTLGTTLAVSGASTFFGAKTLASTLVVSGASTLSSTILVSGAATLGSTLAVSGASTFTGAATLASTLAVSNATTLSSTLVVSGASTLGSTLAVSGASTFTGAATLATTLAVSGASTFFGAKTLASTLAVSGASTLYSTLVVSGASTLGSTLAVTGASTFTGAATLASTLAVTGATTLANTLFVVGKTVLGTDVSMNANVDISGNVNIGKALVVSGAMNLIGDVSLNSRLFVARDISVNGISIGRGNGNISTNTGFGINTLQSVTGTNNTGFGSNSMPLLTTGNQNTAFGNDALCTSTTANRNTAIGYNALRGTNSNDATTNTAIGSDSGKTNSLGSYLTFLGADTDVSGSTINYQRSTAIGVGALITESNQMVLGAPGQALNIFLNATRMSGARSNVIDVSLINFTSESIPASAIVGSSGTSTALTGAVFIENTLSVNNLATFKDNISVLGSGSIGNGLVLSGNLLMTDSANIGGNLTVPSINDMMTFVTYSDVPIASGLANATTNLDTSWNPVSASANLPSGNWLGGLISETGQYQYMYDKLTPAKIYRSITYGTTFEQKSLIASIYDGVNNGNNINNVIAMDYTGKYVAIGGNQSISYSSNFGLTFNELTNSLLNSGGSKISAIAISGNGKFMFVGGTNSKLYVSTDSGTLVGIDSSPIFPPAENNWKSISTNGSGALTMAITNSKLFITDPSGATLYNGKWSEKTSTKHANMVLANVTDSFISNDGVTFGITTTTGLYISKDQGTSWTEYATANGYNSVAYTYIRDPLLDGAYIYLTTASSGKLKKSINSLNSISIVDASGINMTARTYSSVIVSGNGGYTYLFNGTDVSYIPYLQINTGGATVRVPSGTAFVLDKDAEIKQNLIVTKDTSIIKRLYVASDVSLNQKLYVANDVSMNGNVDISNNLRVNGNITMNGGSINTTDLSETVSLFNAATTINLGGTATNINIGTGTGNATTVTIGANGDTVNILGNLNITGTTTTISTTNLDISDNAITLNKGGLDATLVGAGINIDASGVSSVGYIRVDADTARFVVRLPSLAGGTPQYIATKDNANDLSANNFTTNGNITMAGSGTLTMTGKYIKQF